MLDNKKDICLINSCNKIFDYIRLIEGLYDKKLIQHSKNVSNSTTKMKEIQSTKWIDSLCQINLKFKFKKTKKK